MSEETKAKLRAAAAARKATRIGGQAANAEHQGATHPAATEDEDYTEVVVNVADDTPAPALSLKDRLFKKFGGQAEGATHPASAGKKKPSKKEDENLLLSFLPAISGAIAMYASSAWADEYKTCAPNREEVASILAPIMRIIARRVSVSGKVGPDVTDIFAALMAGVAYAGRAYTLYVDIKRDNDEKIISLDEYRAQHPTNAQRRRPYGESSANGDFSGGGNLIQFQSRAHQTTGAYHDRELSSDSGQQSSTNEPDITTLLSKARTKDYQYRVMHGLL